jgi:hypothetical protein
VWSGFIGATGISTFYTDSTVDTTGAWNVPLAALFATIKTYTPGTVTWTFPTILDQIDPVTGKLVGSRSCTAVGSQTGGAAGNYNAAGGVAARWHSTGVVDGHRVDGHTYFVPIGSTGLNPTGGIDAGLQGAANSAINTLIGAMPGAMYLWSRPKKASAAHPAHGGSAWGVSSGAMLPKAVVLRSRRD